MIVVFPELTNLLFPCIESSYKFLRQVGMICSLTDHVSWFEETAVLIHVGSPELLIGLTLH